MVYTTVLCSALALSSPDFHSVMFASDCNKKCQAKGAKGLGVMIFAWRKFQNYYLCTRYVKYALEVYIATNFIGGT